MLDLASLFTPAKNALAGLDIGRRAVRMVELSRNNVGHFSVQGFGSENLLNGAVSDDGIEDLAHVMMATQRLWDKSGCRAQGRHRYSCGCDHHAWLLHRSITACNNSPFAA